MVVKPYSPPGSWQKQLTLFRVAKVKFYVNYDFFGRREFFFSTTEFNFTFTPQFCIEQAACPIWFWWAHCNPVILFGQIRVFVHQALSSTELNPFPAPKFLSSAPSLPPGYTGSWKRKKEPIPSEFLSFLPATWVLLFHSPGKQSWCYILHQHEGQLEILCFRCQRWLVGKHRSFPSFLWYFPPSLSQPSLAYGNQKCLRSDCLTLDLKTNSNFDPRSPVTAASSRQYPPFSKNNKDPGCHCWKDAGQQGTVRVTGNNWFIQYFQKHYMGMSSLFYSLKHLSTLDFDHQKSCPLRVLLRSCP